MSYGHFDDIMLFVQVPYFKLREYASVFKNKMFYSDNVTSYQICVGVYTMNIRFVLVCILWISLYDLFRIVSKFLNYVSKRKTQVHSLKKDIRYDING